MGKFSTSQAAGFLIVGAAIGAAAALLFAPKTGTQTRKDLRRFSKRTAGKLEDLRSDIQDQLNEGYAQVKRIIPNV